MLGALLDLGANLDSILEALKSLNLPGLDIRRERLVKKGISCPPATGRVEEDEHPHRHLSHIEAPFAAARFPRRS